MNEDFFKKIIFSAYKIWVSLENKNVIHNVM